MVSFAQRIAYVVDPDPVARDFVCSIAAKAGLASAGFRTAAAFLAGYRDDAMGCLVLELNLPDTSGLRLQSQLVDRGVDLPRIFWTSQANSRQAVQAMRGGAVDLLRKPLADACLESSMRQAIEAQTRERRRRSHLEDCRQAYNRLTPREAQVFRCTVGGRPNKSTARHLQISEGSVETYRCRLMKKLGAAQVTDLVRVWVALNGWQSPEPDMSVQP